MYPVLFRIGGFEVTSFGVLVAAAALIGLWILQKELDRSKLPSGAVDGAIAGLAGGLLGAKLLWVFEHFGEDPVFALLLSRGGLSWFGGLAGGLAAGLLYFRYHRYPLIPVLAAATPALAIGHAVGRIGCFLVGDDYGRPTNLPWGVAFPEGLPPTTDRVHPTQIYEALALTALAIVLMHWRRRGLPDRVVLGRYLLLAGLVRFAIEFIRVDVRVIFGLSVAHLGALAMAVVGIVVLVRSRSSAREPKTA